MSIEMWAVVAFLGVVVATRAAGVSRFAFLAMVHDSLPVVLIGAWIALGYGLGTQQWELVGMAAILLIVHLLVVVPRVRADATPPWTSTAPQVTVAVANVFVGNRTPGRSARTLVSTQADLVVVMERTDAFMREFELVGGGAEYPFRVDEPFDQPDYTTAVASRRALLPGSRVVQSGSVHVIHAVVQCGDSQLGVVGVHLRAITARSGFRAWRTELRDLTTFLTNLPVPFVVVGDFNSSEFRPGLARLIREVGLIDAHRSVGKGLSASLKLAARGPLARFPAFTRVDHALLSRGVHAMEVVNLGTAGSDHHPFLATLAVQQPSR